MQIKVLDVKSYGFRFFLLLLKQEKFMPYIKNNMNLIDYKVMMSCNDFNYIKESYASYYSCINNSITPNKISFVKYGRLVDFFHRIINLSISRINNEDIIKNYINISKKVKQKFNVLLTKLIGIDEYVNDLINILKYKRQYDNLKSAYSIYYGKELSDDDMKLELKKNKLKLNYYISYTFIPQGYLIYDIVGKKNHLSNSKKNEYYHLLSLVANYVGFTFEEYINQKLHYLFSKTVYHHEKNITKGGFLF